MDELRNRRRDESLYGWIDGGREEGKKGGRVSMYV